MTHIRYSHSVPEKKRLSKPRVAPRKAPSQSRAQATVEAILEATARILSRSGFEALGTNQVAQAAGVSIGSLYQYFPNKEALVSALVERHAQHMADVVTEHVLTTGGSLAEDIRGFVEAMLAAHCIDPSLHGVLLEQSPRLGRQDALERLDALSRGLVQSYLERHTDKLRKRDLGLASYVLYRAVEGTIQAATRERPELLANGQLEDELVDFILRYLCWDESSRDDGRGSRRMGKQATRTPSSRARKVP